MDNIGRKVISSIYGSGTVVSETKKTISILFENSVNAITFYYPIPNKKAPFEFVYDSVNSGIEKEVETELINLLINYLKESFPSVVTRKDLGAYAYKEFFKPNRLKPISVNLSRITSELNNLVSEDKYVCEEKLIHRVSYIPSPLEIQKKEKLDVYLESGDVDYTKLYKILLNFICKYLEETLPEIISKQEISIYLGKNFYSRYGLNSVKLPFEFLKKIKMQLKDNSIVEYKLEKGVFYKLTAKTIFQEKIIEKPQEEVKHPIVVVKAQDISNITKQVETELISFLSSYLLDKRPDSITKGDLANYAMKNFYKGKKYKALKMTQELLESIVNAVNKNQGIVYSLKGNNVQKTIDKTHHIEKKTEVKTTPTIKNTPKAKTELITSSIYVGELIKTIVVIYPKQFYTVSELRNYFINNFNKDPGNLITRNLLIQTCIELYDEDKKYFFVDGEGSTLQLWKANSPMEWQKYGLGTVYIPTVQINAKKYDVRNFTLYVYESLNKVKCVNSLKHHQENVTIRSNNISGSLVSFNAFYCSSCNKYYTTTDVIERNFPLKKYPFIRLNFAGYSGNYRREESELMMYGYSVRADGPSETERHNLLARLMTFDFLSKGRIVAIIRDHINYNGRRANMENAVKKWQDDLDFVQNFSLSKQRMIQTNKVNFIYKRRKQ